MRTKLLAISVISLGMVGLTAIPAFASGTTVSQVYTVTLQAPTLGLTLTAPTTTTASQVLPSGGTLTGQTLGFGNASNDNALTLTNSGNTSGTVSSTLTSTGGLTETDFNATQSAGQFSAFLANLSGTFEYYYNASGALTSDQAGQSPTTIPLSASGTFNETPGVYLSAGTGAGTYAFTFNFTIS